MNNYYGLPFAKTLVRGFGPTVVERKPSRIFNPQNPGAYDSSLPVVRGTLRDILHGVGAPVFTPQQIADQAKALTGDLTGLIDTGNPSLDNILQSGVTTLEGTVVGAVTNTATPLNPAPAAASTGSAAGLGTVGVVAIGALALLFLSRR